MPVRDGKRTSPLMFFCLTRTKTTTIGNCFYTSMTPWSAIDERARRQDRAKETCTCARADAPHIWLVWASYLMGRQPHTKFKRNPPSSLRDMENGCARANVQMQPTLTCVKLVSIGSLPSHAPNLNSIRPAVCEIWKTRVHVRTCRCTPPQTCVKHLSNGSLATHQIWTQSAQPFARSGKRVCTCARADALHLRHVARTHLMGP